MVKTMLTVLYVMHDVLGRNDRGKEPESNLYINVRRNRCKLGKYTYVTVTEENSRSRRL